MVMMGNANVCSDVVGVGNPCNAAPGGACYNDCIAKHSNGKAVCEGGTCMCYYECAGPPTKKCNVGLGRCSADCQDQCCASKCSSSHPGGVGYCDDSLGKQNALCQCQYPC
ncbi:defensin-like protein 182 [Prosopis cineraria]|uniref:defensin-like protein 182 n=1 Tax=Prosopis cineraria TaxID=364024 RepID=UPI00240EF734|nr:defensin-like protein 182 [Prosopis cineraria]